MRSTTTHGDNKRRCPWIHHILARMQRTISYRPRSIDAAYDNGLHFRRGRSLGSEANHGVEPSKDAADLVHRRSICLSVRGSLPGVAVFEKRRASTTGKLIFPNIRHVVITPQGNLERVSSSALHPAEPRRYPREDRDTLRPYAPGPKRGRQLQRQRLLEAVRNVTEEQGRRRQDGMLTGAEPRATSSGRNQNRALENKNLAGSGTGIIPGSNYCSECTA